jgi:hypothetical protein
MDEAGGEGGAARAPAGLGDGLVDRKGIIAVVQTPLGFFALCVLVAEAVAGIVLTSVPSPQRPTLFYGMMSFLGLTILVVAFLAYFRPESVGSRRSLLPGRPREPGAGDPREASAVAATELRLGGAAVVDKSSPVKINFRSGNARSGLVTSEAFEMVFNARINCLLHIRSQRFQGSFIVALSANCTSVSFGTDASCDVVVNDADLSRTHFKLLIEPAGPRGMSEDSRIHLLDMSTLGTSVDGRLVKNEKATLPDRCLIRAAGIDLWFWRIVYPASA